MKVKVALMQMYPKIGNKEYNISRMEDFIHKTMKQDDQVQFIVFPETILTGIEGEPVMFKSMAETLDDGESMKRICQLAKLYHVYIAYGFAEKDAHSERLYNSVVMIDDTGKVMGSYHKTHLFAPAEVWDTPGDTYPIFETSFGKVGIITCWDVAFPEVARIYALEGADLLVVCSNWEDPFDDEVWDETALNTHEEDWDLMLRARAYDNVLPLIAANRVGNDGGMLSWFGRSKIVNPRGKIVKALDTREEGILIGDVDLDESKYLKEKYYTYIEDRRPDTYALLCKEK